MRLEIMFETNMQETIFLQLSCNSFECFYRKQITSRTFERFSQKAFISTFVATTTLLNFLRFYAKYPRMQAM